MRKPHPLTLLLSACPPADEKLWQKHVEGFVTAFVVPEKRERWQWLLTARPRRVGRDSHKLHADLDRRTCERVRWIHDLKGEGLFYGFSDVPRVAPVELAAQLATWDAIYSLVPGKLALYFFHEGEVWLCQAGGTN